LPRIAAVATKKVSPHSLSLNQELNIMALTKPHFQRGLKPGKHFALKRRLPPSRSETIRRGNRVNLPDSAEQGWKVGQRVFFSPCAEGFMVGAIFKRAYQGKVLSSRISQGLRTLRQYGPRRLERN
jgi:hypothetical protein